MEIFITTRAEQGMGNRKQERREKALWKRKCLLVDYGKGNCDLLCPVMWVKEKGYDVFGDGVVYCSLFLV